MPIDEHAAGLDPILHTRAAEVGEALVDGAVQALARILLI